MTLSEPRVGQQALIALISLTWAFTHAPPPVGLEAAFKQLGTKLSLEWPLVCAVSELVSSWLHVAFGSACDCRYVSVWIWLLWLLCRYYGVMLFVVRVVVTLLLPWLWFVLLLTEA